MYAGFRLFLLVLLLVRLSCGLAAAADERRVALVIGNSTYRTAPSLQNTLNDAKDVAAALRRVGFEVIDGLDLDKRGMDAALARFARQVRDADAAFFYFAGHGLQFKGSAAHRQRNQLGQRRRYINARLARWPNRTSDRQWRHR